MQKTAYQRLVLGKYAEVTPEDVSNPDSSYRGYIAGSRALRAARGQALAARAANSRLGVLGSILSDAGTEMARFNPFSDMPLFSITENQRKRELAYLKQKYAEDLAAIGNERAYATNPTRGIMNLLSTARMTNALEQQAAAKHLKEKGFFATAGANRGLAFDRANPFSDAPVLLTTPSQRARSLEAVERTYKT